MCLGRTAGALLIILSALAGPRPVSAQAPPSPGWLGISIAEVGEDLADRLAATFGASAGTGVQIVDVLPAGPAAQARLERGDVIVRIDAQPIWEVRQLQRLVRAQPVGRGLVLTVLRGNARLTVPVSVGTMPPPLRAQLAAERFGIWPREGGAWAGPTSPPPDPPRVLVAFVDPDSPAAQAGIRPLDVILQANHQPIQRLEDLAAAIPQPDRLLSLLLERRDAPTLIGVTLELPR